MKEWLRFTSKGCVGGRKVHFPLLSLLLVATLLFVGAVQTKGQQRRLSVMEYNVENLFDTLHAENLADEEFTPQGSHQWTSPRYWAKLSRLSRVIASAGGLQPVDLVALVEVENDSVLTHLTQRTKLWRQGYEYVLSHSPDRRGVNVALLYQPHRFRPFGRDSLRVLPLSAKQRPTRDVLHVAGEVFTGDTLDVFVCHLPSRRGGKLAQAFRNEWGRRLRAYVDSVMRERMHPKVIITGDFNAYYPEPLFSEHLSVKLPAEKRSKSAFEENAEVCADSLYLLSYALKARDGIAGTYKFQGEWNQLDHFMVNGALLQTNEQASLHTSPADCRIVDFSFLLETERSGEGIRPFRTYLGNYYHGGYSDHLPMMLYLNY